MKKLVFYLFAAFVLIIGGLNTSIVKAAGFKDVSEKYWAYNDIVELSNKKIISGYKDGTFKPNNYVTKAQAAKMVYESLGLKIKAKYPMESNDVPKTHWAYNHIAVLTEIHGFTMAEKFHPNNALTRAEMAKLIVETFDLMKTSPKKFKDVNGDWYDEYVNKMYASGITTGVSKDHFDPNGKVTRAQMSAFLVRAMKLGVNEPIKIGSEYDKNRFLYTPSEQKAMAMINLEEINIIRKKAGLTELVYSEEFSKLATLKAKDMYDNKYYAHMSPTYGRAMDMFKTYGYANYYIGENILMGEANPYIAVERWMGSPPHREGILEKTTGKTYLAIGIYGEKYTQNIYWVNIFVEEF